ncbi:hypothetical protein ACFPYI_16675 [Halomarina salina]|uniref:4Fe-4S ferredoxin-type domain-containing protein n=1 Tax=Halomarina salina TaxID=1872699 RepID=A0ABD5RS37_9EURY|nr:hypothetical protein [Halomarina salina]
MSEDSTTNSRVDALRAARERRPWTVDLVADCASTPSAFKADLPACAVCSAPCETEEVCATAIAKSVDLLDEVGRAQAYHLVENGMGRLRLGGEATVRTADRERPNTFVALRDVTEATPESSDE